jgi:TolB protein
MPPRGSIVFTCFNEGFDDICALDPASGEVRRLTEARATDFYPETGPLGDVIVFSSRRSGAFRITLMDADGGNVRQVGPDHGSHFAPDISPDGEQIVFAYASSNTAGDYQNIWVMNVDGSDARPLTSGAHNDVDPTWSPDGSQIAFASDRGWRPAHWIMDADGGNMRMLPDDVAEHGGRSDWSPDGQWLAFYAGPREARDIYLVATDGSGQSRRLTYNGRNLAPAFSPDGQWIVFTSYREEDNANLFMMRPDGSDVRQLTSDPRADWQPRWGPG